MVLIMEFIRLINTGMPVTEFNHLTFLSELYEEHKGFKVFEQEDDPSHEVTGISVFDIVELEFNEQPLYVTRWHDSSYCGGTHFADYVIKCFVYDDLDLAMKCHAQMLAEYKACP